MNSHDAVDWGKRQRWRRRPSERATDHPLTRWTKKNIINESETSRTTNYLNLCSIFYRGKLESHFHTLTHRYSSKSTIDFDEYDCDTIELKNLKIISISHPCHIYYYKYQCYFDSYTSFSAISIQPKCDFTNGKIENKREWSGGITTPRFTCNIW